MGGTNAQSPVGRQASLPGQPCSSSVLDYQLSCIGFTELADAAKQPEAAPFDLLCHLTYNAPLRTRRQRANRVKKQQTAFFGYFGREAREIQNDLLETYATDGELQFTMPDVLKIPPVSTAASRTFTTRSRPLRMCLSAFSCVSWLAPGHGAC